MKKLLNFIALIMLLPAAAAIVEARQLDTDCVMRLLSTAEENTTVAEIRAQCQAADSGQEDAGESFAAIPPEQESITALDERLASDRRQADAAFSIMAHRPNYILAAAYNLEGWDSTLFQQASGNPDFRSKDIEAQFQVSVKVPLAVGLFDGKADLYAAYSNRSFWQVYSSGNSQPFRETSHEPEAWLQFPNDWEIAGFTNSVNIVGYLHQSNGRGGVLSRSWDRLYANFIFHKGNFAWSIQPWWWANANKSESDNPDIDEYMGRGELRLAYERNRNVLSLMVRNQLESGFDRGGAEFSWSFPVFDYRFLRGYVQYFYGYGESLIDYDRKVNRIGIGISVTDWFN